MNEIVKIRELLKEVIDPELGINIVDLGLVYNIFYAENKSIEVEMTLTTKGCPMGEMIVLSVGEILKSRYPGLHVQVYLTWEPKWTADLITEDGIKLMN